ncbi:hypothetical protein BV22DRAFT_1055231 [Leucogyrophana mollusca]|uniref:Uncharacterized protein n=1 Tax=Leucogyrophana mollusca TaxID=85980 RepID=A0ACB8BYR6_9AGAM|nr:hypothetical protein BV22DRAFT_1055231 [Leucogyrophana mollusca]
MAKSTRSKVKRSFRSKKRETGVYAATVAARLNRLNAKLVSIASKDKDGDVVLEGEDVEVGEGVQGSYGMELDGSSQPAASSSRISTHGPRNSRREEWRKSKGLSAVPKRRGINRQGLPAARRKAGRPSRRR